LLGQKKRPGFPGRRSCRGSAPDYQITTLSLPLRTILSPAFQSKAWANSSIFQGAPDRGECRGPLGLVLNVPLPAFRQLCAGGSAGLWAGEIRNGLARRKIAAQGGTLPTT